MMRWQRKEMMKNRSNYSNLLTEFISNIRLVKSFVTEKQELDRLEEIRKEMGVGRMSWWDVLVRFN